MARPTDRSADEALVNQIKAAANGRSAEDEPHEVLVEEARTAPPGRSLWDVLTAMPALDDEDLARPRDLPRDIDL